MSRRVPKFTLPLLLGLLLLAASPAAFSQVDVMFSDDFENMPNGATPLDNGDILVTEIIDSWISRITREGKVVWSVRAPRIRYPSDAFPTVDGKHVIVADFSKPGRVVIFVPATRRVTWEYFVAEGDTMLDHPSLARELPDTGDIIVADDLRHRVVVIDRATKKIVWQYGVTDTPGHKPGYLYYPDGFDLNLLPIFCLLKSRDQRKKDYPRYRP